MTATRFRTIAVTMTLCLVSLAQADVRLPRIFSDHMVLQRDLAVNVWGWAEPGEKVTVLFDGQAVSATADAKGEWRVKLEAMKANATPRDVTVKGKNSITITNVLVGDVWVCSGQSNMEFDMNGCNAPEDSAAANYPTLRQIKLDHRAMGQPDSEVAGEWAVCTSKDAPGFTAVGFYFARRIQKETGVPIGLLNDNWGGTRIEPWTPLCGFEMVPSLANMPNEVKQQTQEYRAALGKQLDALSKWVSDAKTALASPDATIPPQPSLPNDPLTDAGVPTTLFNGMISPVMHYGIKGAIWYQGESNGGEGDEYYDKMTALIGGWRTVWNQGDFPFYFVQLANFQRPNDKPEGGDGWAKVRMAQTKSLTIPKTGMAVAIDLADADNPDDIHPKNKFDVGERLALWALAKDYGKAGLVYSGPLYKDMKIEGGKIRLTFECIGSGLIAGKKEGRTPVIEDAGAQLKRFAIAGEDKKWQWADTAIEGQTVVVSSPQVPKPVAVRYAFSMNPEGCNLYNKEGLPASPFRTDNW